MSFYLAGDMEILFVHLELCSLVTEWESHEPFPLRPCIVVGEFGLLGIHMLCLRLLHTFESLKFKSEG